MTTLDKTFLENMRAFVQRVYEYRPPVDVEAGALPYNTCDYYAMEEYMKEIDELIKRGDDMAGGCGSDKGKQPSTVKTLGSNPTRPIKQKDDGLKD